MHHSGSVVELHMAPGKPRVAVFEFDDQFVACTGVPLHSKPDRTINHNRDPVHGPEVYAGTQALQGGVSRGYPGYSWFSSPSEGS